MEESQGAPSPPSTDAPDVVTKADLEAFAQTVVAQAGNAAFRAFQSHFTGYEQRTAAIDKAVQDVLTETRRGRELLAQFAAGEVSSENVAEVERQIGDRLKSEQEQRAKDEELTALRKRAQSGALTDEQMVAQAQAKASADYTTHHRDDLQDFAADQGFTGAQWTTIEQEMKNTVGKVLPTRADGSIDWPKFKKAAKAFIAGKADTADARKTPAVLTPSVRQTQGVGLKTGDEALLSWLVKRKASA